MHTTKSSYERYKDMQEQYEAVLWREGSTIKGTIEKISETTTCDGKRTYTGDKRTRGEIEGFIHKHYFDKDQISLHIVEQGEKRQYTHYHDLIWEQTASMVGQFIKTSADSKGIVTWSKGAPSAR